MDNTLLDIFNQGQYSLIKPGMDAFNQTQQKALVDMQALQGQEQRAQAMHPLQMLSQQATARLNDSTARINEDKIAATPAPNVRLEQAMKEFHAKSDDLTREQARSDITQRLQRAAAIKANKGAIPAWMQIRPEDMKYYSGPGLDQTIALGEAFMKYDPKELGKRWDDERSQALKTTVPGKAAGSGGGSATPSKMNFEQQINYLNEAARNEADPAKKQMLQAEADRVELMMYRKAREAAAARKVGEVDIGDPKFNTPTVQAEPLTPTPRNNPAVAPSSGSPAQGRMVQMKSKDGKVYNIPADKVQAAKARGWTE